MKLFNWLFGKKQSRPKALSGSHQVKDAEEIKVYDKYGREFYITKEQWKENVLIGNLEQAKNNPDDLFNMLVGALQDGFFEEAVKYAEILVEIDHHKSRAATILGIAYMNSNRLDDAERTLANFVKSYGDDGIVLTNLAKVYSAKGDTQKAESVLWHALEIDPNQENGLLWYATIQKERNGEEAFRETFRKVALFTKSWRAQLWLARFALEQKDIASARKLYIESIKKAGSPVPDDLLVQMSGDLGNNGYLKEVLELVQPHFQASSHSIGLGNNLIKTNFDLGQLNEAQTMIDQLYELNRPDWRDPLLYWEKEIAKKKTEIESKTNPSAEPVVLFSTAGLLWCPNDDPFASLLPFKDTSSVKIFIFGNTTLHRPASQNIGPQLTDAPGRTSRAIPLFLSEQIYLTTNADSYNITPWMQTKGFAVFGSPSSEQELCEMAETSDVKPDLVLSVVVDVTGDLWEITVNVIRRIDRLSLEKITVKYEPEDPGPIALELSKKVIHSLIKYSGLIAIRQPGWYAVPAGVSTSNYLLRLEQLLTLLSMNQYPKAESELYGVHEIIEGILFLNLSHPDNKTVRMILVQTLKQMKKYKHNLIDLYKEKILLLQKDHPLDGTDGELISKTIADIF